MRFWTALISLKSLFIQTLKNSKHLFLVILESPKPCSNLHCRKTYGKVYEKYVYVLLRLDFLAQKDQQIYKYIMILGRTFRTLILVTVAISRPARMAGLTASVTMTKPPKPIMPMNDSICNGRPKSGRITPQASFLSADAITRCENCFGRLRHCHAGGKPCDPCWSAERHCHREGNLSSTCMCWIGVDRVHTQTHGVMVKRWPRDDELMVGVPFLVRSLQ